MSINRDITTTSHRGGSVGAVFDDFWEDLLSSCVIVSITIWHSTVIIGLEVRVALRCVASAYRLTKSLDFYE